MCSILVEVPTTTEHKHQYSEGTNNVERRMIDGAK